MDAAEHDRYDELAVGHVLGGLDPVDSAEFRSHLVGCRTCRLRVAELRDLASELAAAEREERAAARLKTELRSDETEPAEDDAAGRRAGFHGSLPIIAIVSVLVILGVFWAFQLRTQNAELLEATERRETTLALLAEGQPVEVDFTAGVSGPVVVDASRVGLSLSGLPSELPEGHVLVLWLDGDDGTRVLDAFRGPLPEGRLALHAAHEGAEYLLVTVQPAGAMDAPVERPLVRAHLDRPMEAVGR